MDIRKLTLPLKRGRQPCTIIFRKNQKYINILITREGQVILSAPRGTTMKEIEAAASRKLNWIEGHILKLEKGYADLDPLKQLFLMGKSLAVTIAPSKKKRGRVVLDTANETLIIESKHRGRVTLMLLLKGWLEKTARRYLQERVSYWTRETGISINRVFFRNQHTRWGSSSGRGNISLNWRIIMIPPPVQDYLIIHELVHQIHMNHSRKFWEKVGSYCSEYREYDNWLKKNSILMGLFRGQGPVSPYPSEEALKRR
jgi:predicted metal-dependent hydrolase